MYVAWLSPHGPQGDIFIDCYFSLQTHTKQVLLVTFCDITAGIGASFRTHTHGHTDMEVEVVIYISMIARPRFFAIFASKSSSVTGKSRTQGSP